MEKFVKIHAVWNRLFLFGVSIICTGHLDTRDYYYIILQSKVKRSPTDCDASLCVWSRNLKNEETMAHVGPQRHKNK